MLVNKKQKVEHETSPYFRTDKNEFTGAEKLLRIENELSEKLNSLRFGPPIEYVYNPLEYAKELHSKFVRKYFITPTKKIMFLGMNPGPWGMSQTGIPFGEHKIVTEWFQISGNVSRPEKEHPLRKVEGLDCHRSEISGKKFWGLFKTLCDTPEIFFEYSFVYNVCPLAFMTSSGKNVTPAEIKGQEQKTLNSICDEAFLDIIKDLQVEIIVGIGKFAEKRAISALKNYKESNVKVLSIPHPSPRNLKNSTNWAEATVEALKQHDLLQYFTAPS